MKMRTAKTSKWSFFLLYAVIACLDLAMSEPSKQVIESFNVQTDIRYRFATTRMTSIVRNTAGSANEMNFHVTLPKQAFITSFEMMIDGKVYEGEVKEKREAKEQYVKAVQQGQSAGHIRQTPRHSNRFDVSVNVENEKTVNFTLIYQQILSRKFGLYEYEMHVNPGQAVKDFNVEVFIQENRPLLFVKTPKLRTATVITNEAIEAPNDLTTIDRPSETSAHILYKPTLSQQGSDGIAARFVIQYDLEHSDSGEVLVADGYFIHLFSPKPTIPLPKDIIFVLDVSGSMSGTKMAQVKDAMKTILDDLHEEDRFNIFTFSSEVSKWKKLLVKATLEVVEKAKTFVDSMRADGGTNINSALLTALNELKKRELQKRVGMIFFLTDGDATVGETNTAKIASNVQEANDVSSIFSLAFGQGADFESLKTISTQNTGFARKIYEASDAALQVASLYEEISVVAMKDVKVKYLPSVTKTTETVFPVVFNKTEIMIGGCIDLRIRNDEWREAMEGPQQNEVFRAEIEGLQQAGEIDIVLEIDDLDEVTIDDDSLNPFFSMPRDYAGIIEKMWAFLTIKQLLNEKQKEIEMKEKVAALDKKILDMSLKYKFVTPLTSMVVTKPDSDSPEASDLEDVDRQPERGRQASYGSSRRRFHSGRRGPAGVVSSFPLSKHASGPAFAMLPPGSTTVAKRKQYSKKLSKGKKVRRNRKGKQAKFAVLGSIVLRDTDNKSVCIVPKKTMSGNYLLLQDESDIKVELSTACAKNCRLVVPVKLMFTANGRTTAVNMTTSGTWEYQQHPVFNTIVKMNELVFMNDAMSISVSRNKKGKKMIYSVSVVVAINVPLKFSGMIDVIQLMMKKKRKQRKVPRNCMSQSVDMSFKLSKRLAAKYKV